MRQRKGQSAYAYLDGREKEARKGRTEAIEQKASGVTGIL